MSRHTENEASCHRQQKQALLCLVLKAAPEGLPSHWESPELMPSHRLLNERAWRAHESHAFVISIQTTQTSVRLRACIINRQHVFLFFLFKECFSIISHNATAAQIHIRPHTYLQYVVSLISQQFIFLPFLSALLFLFDIRCVCGLCFTSRYILFSLPTQIQKCEHTCKNTLESLTPLSHPSSAVNLAILPHVLLLLLLFSIVSGGQICHISPNKGQLLSCSFVSIRTQLEYFDWTNWGKK